jgi:thioredoxin 1
MKPILEEAAKTLGEAVDVRTVNVEDEPELAGAFGIRGVPTVVVLRDGRPVDAWMGVLPAEQIVRRLEEKLGLPVRVGGAG